MNRSRASDAGICYQWVKTDLGRERGWKRNAINQMPAAEGRKTATPVYLYLYLYLYLYSYSYSGCRSTFPHEQAPRGMVGLYSLQSEARNAG